jgi:hypothetical protein
MRLTALVLLASLGTAAQAAPTLTFEPANPTPADTIVLTIRDSSTTCPYVVPASMRFAPPNEIRLTYAQVTDCGFGPFSETKTTLGQLPAGTYSVIASTNYPDISPSFVEGTKQLTVSYPAGASTPNPTAPLENYGGHYQTGHFGEGVFIEQYGEKSFLTWATYDGEGRAAWVFMPDARWGFNATRGGYEFSGAVYRTRRGQESPPSVTVTPIGTGSWYPTTFDTVILTLTIDGSTNRATIRRYRF